MAVHLTKIYTRTGDDGTTGLSDFSRVAKTDPRVVAYADCDTYLASLEKLRSFILPGGTPGAAHLHVALTVVRRAERSVWAAIEAYGTEPGTARGEGGINPTTATYLNRLSDLLFVLARYANLPGGDVLWAPGGGREQPPTPS